MAVLFQFFNLPNINLGALWQDKWNWLDRVHGFAKLTLRTLPHLREAGTPARVRIARPLCACLKVQASGERKRDCVWRFPNASQLEWRGCHFAMPSGTQQIVLLQKHSYCPCRECFPYKTCCSQWISLSQNGPHNMRSNAGHLGRGVRVGVEVKYRGYCAAARKCEGSGHRSGSTCACPIPTTGWPRPKKCPSACPRESGRGKWQQKRSCRTGPQ